MTDTNPTTPDTTPERNTDMKNSTIETPDLHALLDSLANGDRIKAAWDRGEYTITMEGPVTISGREVWCGRILRDTFGEINNTLTSFEVTRDTEVTVTDVLRWNNGKLCRTPHSVARRTVAVHQWEREKEKKEHPRGAMSAGTHTSGHTFDLNVAASIHNQPNHDRATCTRCQLRKLMWGEKL